MSTQICESSQSSKIYNMLTKVYDTGVKITSVSRDLFNSMCSESKIPSMYHARLKRLLLSENLIVKYETIYKWNSTFAKPNEQMANRLLNLLKIKPSVQTKNPIKDVPSERLVVELRSRGYDVTCIKHIEL